jgi:putative membrane-bound dehydrogenase-like protein
MQVQPTRLSVVIFLLLQSFFLFPSCNSGRSKTPEAAVSDSLSEAQKHLPENALKGLIVTGGLDVKAVAYEPALINPTNIDVDERGRIWVVEAFNYRPKINGNPVNPQGDRIMILEDKDGDGKAENSKVFYQGSEINAPMGICVLGKRVIISQSPYVWSFYDDNGDDSADRKEVLFQGIGGEQHDHGMHTFTFGPDGKLYFNFGNEGKTLKDKAGKTVVDQDGDEIGPKKYKQGMVFRCNPDGTQVECLGHNFRNNYEVAVDSYGTMWQSDNDDDGNKGVRINYVMEYGNFGYHDEMTDATWQAPRTNLEDSIYERHWHLNDPGVVPNLLQTGAGSPTGMLVYEGMLLPKEFQGQLIHCDAGPNVVRSYPVTKHGAGYKATAKNILNGNDDQWFRPADVCTAPDGSIMVADWYDPFVGGHGAGDQDRGRIYRVAPAGAKYNVPKFDFTTPAGAVAALQNPNLAARYLAWEAIQKMGKRAIPELEKLWRSGSDPRMRARALWALSKTLSGKTYITEAINETHPDLRITGLRAAREMDQDVLTYVAQLTHDADPQVLRECALALRHNKAPEAARLWADLAMQYKGGDRWLLEALGIGADRQWGRFFAAYRQANKEPLQNAAGRDLVWRARGDEALPLLAVLAMDSATALQERLRYFRSFDFHPGAAKNKTLLSMMAAANPADAALAAVLLRQLSPAVVQASRPAQVVLARVLDATYRTPEYLNLVRQYGPKAENDRLLHLMFAKWDSVQGPEAVRLLLELGHKAVLQQVMRTTNADSLTRLFTAISTVGYPETVELLERVVLSDKYNKPTRLKAAEMLGKSMTGEDRVLELFRDARVPVEYMPAMVDGMKYNVRTGMYKKAGTYLTGSKDAGAKPVPSLAALLPIKGDAQKGHTIFKNVCAICHQVRGEGNDFGPKLSEIGSKLPREALFKSLTNPSSAISFGYEATRVLLKNSTVLLGIVTSKTESDLTMKFADGAVKTYKLSEIKSIKELPESLMPPMYEALSNEELADVVQYLSSLNKK